MTEKLAAKHTNSLALTKHKLLQREGRTKSYCCPCTKPHKLAIFCIVSCCIFLLYWIILTPLLINHPDNLGKNQRFSVSFILYWVGAFLVWLFIMVAMVLLWRCFAPKDNEDAKQQSYGTNGAPKSVSFDDDVKLRDLKLEDEHLGTVVRENRRTSISDESRRDKPKRRRDLPPLVIHRRNMGNDVGCVASVDIEENDNGESNSKRGSQKEQRESMKSYLKLVTVTPQDDTDTKTPKTLSPRELFFIDLIREAEKAEQSKGTDNSGKTDRRHFFPNDFLANERDAVSRDSSDRQKSGETSKTDTETTYFIADVDSPKSEKAEVYLEIEPHSEAKEWSVDLNHEKPVLRSRDDVKNVNDEKKVVLFEV